MDKTEIKAELVKNPNVITFSIKNLAFIHSMTPKTIDEKIVIIDQVLQFNNPVVLEELWFPTDYIVDFTMQLYDADSERKYHLEKTSRLRFYAPTMPSLSKIRLVVATVQFPSVQRYNLDGELSIRIAPTMNTNKVKIPEEATLSRDLVRFMREDSIGLGSVAITTEDGETIHANVFVLAARSPVFRAMFNHDMQERKEMKLTLDDVSSTHFKQFLWMLHSDTLPDDSKLSIEDATYLASLANRYDVPAAKTLAINHVLEQLGASTLDSILRAACKHHVKEIVKEALVFSSKTSKDLETVADILSG